MRTPSYRSLVLWLVGTACETLHSWLVVGSFIKLLLAAQHVQQVVFTHRLGQRQASVLAGRVVTHLSNTSQAFATALF
jgi:hypothetical protein